MIIKIFNLYRATYHYSPKRISNYFIVYFAVGLKIFHGFLKKEYAEENLLFWLSVERLKKERDPTAFKNMAQTIYNDYVSTESPKEVVITERLHCFVIVNH